LCGDRPRDEIVHSATACLLAAAHRSSDCFLNDGNKEGDSNEAWAIRLPFAGMAYLPSQPLDANRRMDLFVVRSATFEPLYAFIIVRLARGDLVWINVTSHPPAEWITPGRRRSFQPSRPTGR